MNYIKTTAPLSMDLIKQQFEDDTIKFVIDYKNSELKSKNLLVYISNLELNCEVDFLTCSFEEKSELILEFLTTNSINNIDSLKLNAALVILHHMKVDFSNEIVEPCFNKDELDDFCKVNVEVLVKWRIFLQSTMLYNLTCIGAINEEHKFEEVFEAIDDPFYVGRNIVTMFSIPTFMELLYTVKSDGQVYYFTQQFKECMFKGESLFHYFCHEANTPFVMFNMLLTGEINLDQVTNLNSSEE